tara:strand:+ start:67 stop:795 length:729 start_codon:yes stop_codon:yes gene_type:complete
MIFNLFKSKPTLRELIPNGFVDIHSHILPGIDDGAKNIDESIELISEMKKLGFSKIIGTPHTYQGLYENTANSIQNSFNNLNKEKLGNIKISYASEYLINKKLVEMSEEKNLLCLKDNYLLVEMSYLSKPINLYDILFKLQINGYIPILAHPERYRFLYDDLSEFSKLKNVGCKFQMNLLSMTGFYGKDVAKTCDYLIKKNYINFFGTDAHNLRHLKNIENKILINNYDKIEKLLINNSFFI